MQTSVKAIAAVCCAGALAGCAVNQKTANTTIVPAMKVQHSYESTEGYYALGRYYHGARRFDDAMEAYRQALALEPGHLRAANAMAVLYAERGDFQNAISLLNELVEAAPDAAHLLSNLGHVYFLKGDYQAAETFLEKAIALDPMNARAWSNLGSTVEKLGDTAGSRRMFARAQEMGAGKSLQAGGGVQIAVSTGLPVAPAVTATALEIRSRAEISEVGPNIYEVRQVSVAYHERNPFPATDVIPLTVPVRVEVSNGNGINGMARAVGKRIERRELKVVRLTNQNRFAVKSTRVEYKDGFEKTARELAEGLGRPAIVKLNVNGRGVDVRVVLGRDLSNPDALRSQYLDRQNGDVQGRLSAR